MGTLLYVVLKFAGMIDSPDDWINICHLAAIDSVAAAILFNGLLRRRATAHQSAKDTSGNAT